MKLLYGIVILCFATANAFVVESPERLVNNLINGMTGLVADNPEELKAFVEEQFTLDDLELLRNRNKTKCIKAAFNDAIDLVDDVNDALEQLVFDGLDLVKSFKKCKKINNKDEKRACFADLGDDLVDYVDDGTKSVAAIVKSVEDVQQIYKDMNKCLASNKLENIVF